nr:APC family permease [Leekyejoonella antrihumi]
MAVAAMTMANMAPAMSFIFGFAIIASASGLASPLTVLVAGVACLFLVNTMSQFSMFRPSTGSFVSFIGAGLGRTVGTVFALVLALGYIVLGSSVIGLSGGWAESAIKHYTGVTIPWQVIGLVTIAVVALLVVRGVQISVKWSARFYALELTTLLLVSTWLLISHHHSISWDLLSPAHWKDGFSGFALGFPLAIFLFIGWEDSAAMAEESHNPRKNVGRAMLFATVLLTVVYTYLSFSTVVGFNKNSTALAAQAVPFLSAAQGEGAVLVFLVYLAGLTSIFACLIGAANAQARIIFNSGREGMLFSYLGRVHDRFRTPYLSLLTYLGVGFVLLIAWGWGGGMDTVTYFGEAGTLGTILVMLTYFCVNIALPVYVLRERRSEFNIVRHGILPLIGAAIVIVPLYTLTEPGQPAPYNYFPYIALGIVVLALGYAIIRVRNSLVLREKFGAFIADDHELVGELEG